MFLIFLSIGLVGAGGDNFNISSVGVVWSPPDCGNISLAILVHSHPSHSTLRRTLRQTWASQHTRTDFTTRTIFVIGGGESEELSVSLEKERQEHSDILRGDFIDSYRNLTYKHLLGYRWLNNNCAEADYVLKVDDDQFVDTLQLPYFLQSFLPPPSSSWFLCNVLRRPPVRDPSSKWFVTRSEWADSDYPQYCAGWAYVTTLATVSQVLAWSSLHPYFWIDDLHITGSLPSQHGGLQMFDWVYSFLSTHVQYSQELLQGTFYTPELMVCGDVTAGEIEHLWRKAERCGRMKCWEVVYSDPGHRETVRPVVRVQGQDYNYKEPKQEL